MDQKSVAPMAGVPRTRGASNFAAETRADAARARHCREIRPLYLLVYLAICSTGCAPTRPGPVAGYTAVIRSAGGIPGKPGKYHLRVRVTRVDGKPLTEQPPYLAVDEVAAGPVLTAKYTSRMVRYPGKSFCDLAVQGTLGRQVTQPTTVAVSLFQYREVPTWRQIITTLSTQRMSEVSARTLLGTFVVPADTATASKRKARMTRSLGR